MTETSSDAFLSGQGIPVDPRDIETELTRLWGPAAERVGGPASRARTSRGSSWRTSSSRAGWPTRPGSTACSTR